MVEYKTCRTKDELPQKGLIGEIIYVEELKCYCMYNKDGWQEIAAAPKDKADGGLELSLLDLNRTAIAALPTEKPQDTKKKHSNMLNFWYKEHPSNYYMLYGKEISYFTLFAKNDSLASDNLVNEVLVCVSDVGNLHKDCIHIDTETNGIEFWVKTPEGDTTVLILFDYEQGVVYFR